MNCRPGTCRAALFTGIALAVGFLVPAPAGLSTPARDGYGPPSGVNPAAEGTAGIALAGPMRLAGGVVFPAAATASYLRFDGVKSYVEIPSSNVFSLATGGGLTVSAWIRPAALTFPSTEGSGYVHWMGKGEKGRYEWVFRMYSQGNAESRANRISFYVFNPQGGEGVGSYFQDAIVAGEWIQVVGVADGQRTYIYKNSELRKCDQYRGAGDGSCGRHPIQVDPEAGPAPLRIGTRDLKSFFKGEIREVRIWDRALTPSEISGLYSGKSIPQKGLAAEYLLTDGTARDSKGGRNGTVIGATWIH
jgi:hypothetical protein